MKISGIEIDEFTSAYLQCALWSSSDDKDVPLDHNYQICDISPESLEKMIEDCRKFQEDNAELLAQCDYGKARYTDLEMAGSDFWLTRNGHGCGYWENDCGEVGVELDKAVKAGYHQIDLYVGDDGKVYC